jgi:N-methylhydantoinase B/oxoprolinase/acetone carboxylase alpha subunit
MTLWRFMKRDCGTDRSRIVESGRERPDAIDLICRNSRFPRSARGHLSAQIGSCRMGERRFQQLADRFSHETIRDCTTEIFTQSERLDREAVASIHDGTYEAKGRLDRAGYARLGFGRRAAGCCSLRDGTPRYPFRTEHT